MISWAYVIFLFLLDLKACNEEGKRSGKRLNYMQNMKCVSMTTAFINLKRHSFYSLIPYRTKCSHIDLIGYHKTQLLQNWYCKPHFLIKFFLRK